MRKILPLTVKRFLILVFFGLMHHTVQAQDIPVTIRITGPRKEPVAFASVYTNLACRQLAAFY
jgi:hypothetical protein